MDSDLFMITGISPSDTVWLDTETGLDNIREMMDRDRSLF